jgi:hypothetical protein
MQGAVPKSQTYSNLIVKDKQGSHGCLFLACIHHNTRPEANFQEKYGELTK